MKFIEKYNGLEPVYTQIFWLDHKPACAKCREVDIERSATFANACAQGSVLLAEELAKRQAPIVKKKAAEVREWAKKTGVFKGCG